MLAKPRTNSDVVPGFILSSRIKHLALSIQHPASVITLLGMLALISALAGCGGAAQGLRRAPVRGTIRLDGQPIEQGYISFYPIRQTKGPIVGVQISNGEFKVSKSKGPVVGWNRLVISSKRKSGKKIPMGSPHPPDVMTDEIVEAVPARYNTDSTLEHEIENRKNVIDLDLVSK
jgi:hypothetical protein